MPKTNRTGTRRSSQIIPMADNTSDSKSSRPAEDQCNEYHNMKGCDFTWCIRTYDVVDTAYANVHKESVMQSSVDGDFEYYLELKNYKDSNNTECAEFLSLFLCVHVNDSLRDCDAVLGEVEFSVLKSSSKFGTKKRKFEIKNNGNVQWKTYVGFREYVKRIHAANWAVKDELKIFCKIFYCVMTEKENKSREILNFSLSNDLERLFADKNFSDVTIQVKDREYHVYKGILAARSPVFDAMFRNDMRENATNVVKISDIGQDVFEEILRYIYCGKVKNFKKLVYEILPAANKYDLKELMDLCEETLAKQLSKDNAIKILILAHIHDAVWLKTEALEFIKLHGHSANVKDSEIWKVLTSFHPDLMAEMLIVLLHK
ncbi:speckle-type POZ protein B-like [Planococcus citri]|uniref:speckle-type POZ protein B-like n=1 Tax=Planococcus citri TaxID=170843 RepID=UPI0031F8F45F